MLGVGPGIGEDEAVLGQGGYVEADGKAALLGAFQVSGTPELHVFFGQFKTVFGGAEEVQALLAFLGDFVAFHQDAVGAFGSPAHASAQLMQLAQAESFGTLNDHHGGVGYVHAHLDDGGGDQDVGAARHKGVHVEGFFLRVLLAVDNGHFVIRQREGFHNLLVPQLQVLVVQFFAFEDERVHNEGLAAFGNLVPYEIVHGVALAFSYAHRGYGLSARRHLVYHGYVQVSVQGHGQGAGDGGSRHHQHVRRDAVVALVPKAGALLHAKAVLLVHDGQAQGPELHRVFNQGMRANQNADAAIQQAGVDFPSPGGRGGAGEQGALDTGGSQVFGDIGVMLLGKDFRGGHDAGLVAVSHGNKGTEYRHHGFSGAYVSLEEAVHLVAALHILPDFPYHALLGAGELVGKGVVAVVERLAHLGHGEAHGVVAADILLFEEAQLEQEQFLKLEAVGCLGQSRLVHGKVNLSECVGDGHQALFL